MTQSIIDNAPLESAALSTPTKTQPGIRRFGSVNWLGLWTFYKKEVQRFLKVSFQTILAPVVTTLLYLVVFTQAFGDVRPAVGGVSFIVFLTPGLIMMAILNNAFANSSSSLIIGKVQGSIVDILMAPLSATELAVGFVAGAATRGLLVGLITALTAAVYMSFSTPMPINNLLAIFYFGISAAIMFSLLGVLGGVWAEKFDQLAAITNFVIMPLTFLSGTFYPISRLPEPFLTLTKFNPIFMLIDGFRYGFTNNAEASVAASALVVLVINLILAYLCYSVLRSGWKIKS